MVRPMRSHLFAFTPLACAAICWSGTAHAVSFDDGGNLSFEPDAAFVESFETFEPPEAGLTVQTIATPKSLHGQKLLRLFLEQDAFVLPLTVAPERKSYHLTFFISGDCVGGAAVDYDDGRTGTVAQAFPTGRMTSDGWVEMQTAPFEIDAAASGVYARLFIAAYSEDYSTSVDVDAVELMEDGVVADPVACKAVNDPACKSDQMCLTGVCRDARGWFPPLPSEETRDKLVTYWKEKIQFTYGPFLPRQNYMPDALAHIEPMRWAKTNVEYWSRFSEVIRMLRDAHTYTRHLFTGEFRIERPLNACFVQGVADMTTGAWPSDAKWPDVLVSHVGPEFSWGLHSGDRLVAVDGQHPLVWVRSLFPKSPWTWEADDPAQLANQFMFMRAAIQLHANTITVIRCDPVAKTCSQTPEIIEIASAEKLAPGQTVTLVGCDNRPQYHVDGAPEDHNFGDALVDPVVVEGTVFETTAEEKIHGLVWNSVYGDGMNYPVDEALNSATKKWISARGVVQDHREGHGGTVNTANILASFSRKTFIPYVDMMRVRAVQEGPKDAAEGKQWFEQLKDSVMPVGSNWPHLDIPVALLLTWDVSASDFLPYMMKGGAKVRLFGPGPTMGAFGTFSQYGYWGGLRWSISAEDSISPEGMPLTGHGVVPDEIVVPLQSDLVQGKDTLHEAAMAWVRKELKP
jgi:hypothetical protein